MSENYKEIEVLKYVKEGIESGTMIPFGAEKFARILARRGVIGEEVVTMSVDDEGNPIVEKIDTVKKDEKTGKPGMVVTKADDYGNPIIDENGNANTWIIDDSTFIKKYELTEGTIDFYRPIGGSQIFVEIPEDIRLFQWGGFMNIAKGGYINITNADDMYGISKRDFEDTYRRISSSVKTLKK